MENKKRHRLRIGSLLAVLITLCIASAAPAMAYSYTTDLYKVDIAVSEDNTYDITETIDVYFDTPKHGIYRYIPTGGNSDMGYMKIKDVRVSGYEYSTYSEDGNRVIRIGSEDETVTGRQRYKINYRMEVYDDRNTDKDFLYIDLIPTGWETPIAEADITVKMPKRIDEANIKIYSGLFKDTENSELAEWTYDEESREIHIRCTDMRRGAGITLLCKLPEGYWQGEGTYSWARTAAVLLVGGISAAVILLWFFFGRDRKPVPTVEFYPPEGMNPAEVGYIIDRTINKKDLVSLIMYFADKGYMSIEQTGKKNFTFTKVKDIDPSEKKFAKTLFNGLFESGNTVNIKDLDESFGERYYAAYEQLYNHFVTKSNRQVSIKSVVFQILALIFLVAAQMAAAALAGWFSGDVLPAVLSVAAAAASAGIMAALVIRTKKQFAMKTGRRIAGGLVLWIIKAALTAAYAFLISQMFGRFVLVPVFGLMVFAAEISAVVMDRRTDKSVELLGRILGLKNFIERAELDRINSLVEENPDYYYNILPYAYVMGLTDKWAKNFESIAVKPPAWYTGYGGADMFDIWMFSNMMNRCGRAFESNIHIPTGGDSGSGGGGFTGGGGGFSGSGFGGGGGGSW